MYFSQFMKASKLFKRQYDFSDYTLRDDLFMKVILTLEVIGAVSYNFFTAIKKVYIVHE